MYIYIYMYLYFYNVSYILLGYGNVQYKGATWRIKKIILSNSNCVDVMGHLSGCEKVKLQVYFLCLSDDMF